MIERPVFGPDGSRLTAREAVNRIKELRRVIDPNMEGVMRTMMHGRLDEAEINNAKKELGLIETQVGNLLVNATRPTRTRPVTSH